MVGSQYFNRTPLGDLCDFKTYVSNLSNQYNFYKKTKKLQTKFDALANYSKRDTEKRAVSFLSFSGNSNYSYKRDTDSQTINFLKRDVSLPLLFKFKSPNSNYNYKKKTGFYNSLFYLTREKKKKLVQNFDKTSLFYNHLERDEDLETFNFLKSGFNGTSQNLSFSFFLSKYLLIHLKNQKNQKTTKEKDFSINQTNCQILYKEGWVYKFNLGRSKRLKDHQSFLPAAGRNQSLVDNLCFDQVPVFLEYILNKKKDSSVSVTSLSIFNNFYENKGKDLALSYINSDKELKAEVIKMPLKK